MRLESHPSPYVVFSRGSGGLTSLIGCLVLGGWLLNVPFLKNEALRIGALTLGSMKPDTALCFFFVGIALWLLCQESNSSFQNYFVRCSAVLVLIVGSCTLGEYFTNHELSIGQFFFNEAIPAFNTYPPDHMAPLTALGLMLVGSALYLFTLKGGLWPAQILTLGVVAIALLVLVGHLYNIPVFYRTGTASPIALHTIGTFLLLSIGLLSMQPSQGLMSVLTDEKSGSVAARRMLPVAIVLPFVVGWIRLQGQHLGFYGTEMGIALFATVNVLSFVALICWNALALNRRDEERNRAAESLQAGQARFAGIVNSAMDAIITIDSNRNITLYNPAAERLFGYTAAAMMDQRIDMLIPPRFQDGQQQNMDVFGQGDRSSQQMKALGIVSGLRANGEKFPLEVSVSQVKVGGQRLSTVILRDVTEREQAEMKLRASEEQFRLLVEGIHDSALFLMSPDGYVVSWNPGAERTKGYKAEEIIGQHYSRFYSPEDIAGGKPEEELRIARENGHYEDEGWRMRKDGSRFWGNVVVTALRDEEGNLRGFAKVIRDITERKQAELAIRAKNEEIQTVSQQLWQATKLATMGELASSIAHELNNPLATVSLRVESLLAQAAEGSPQSRSLDIIEQEIARVSSLVSNLLQFSRRSGPQISTVEVPKEIESTLELIQYQLRNRNIRIERDFTADVPLIQADRHRLRQLFLNLFTNASDAMPQGGNLTLTVKGANLIASPHLGTVPKSPSEIKPVAQFKTCAYSHVLIQISDTGVGIKLEDLNRVFESFYTTKPEGKGTGLGLPICRRIVEEHNGTLDLNSHVGQGTTISILLPVDNGSCGLYLKSTDDAVQFPPALLD